MSQEKVKNIVEAALMVSTEALSITRLLSLFEQDPSLQPERTDVRAALEQLQQDYLERGVELVEVASGFRFQARDDYAPWVNRLFDERPPRYSRALLETLAIIAYRQPITRGEIEEIRGVSVSGSIVKTLQERDWIKVVGHRDVPGKPELLASTKTFLDYFNLKKLSDLPALSEIKDFDSINPDLFEALEKDKQESSDDANTSELIDTDLQEHTQADDNSDSVSEDETMESVDVAEIDEEEVEAGAKVIPITN